MTSKTISVNAQGKVIALWAAQATEKNLNILGPRALAFHIIQALRREYPSDAAALTELGVIQIVSEAGQFRPSPDLQQALECYKAYMRRIA